jgi:outer membrane receptor for ferrienterochelin and colicins
VALGGRYEDTGSSGVTDKSVNGALSWIAAPGQTFEFDGTYGVQETVNQPPLTSTGTARTAWGASELERSALRVSHKGDWGFGQSRIDVYRNAFEWKMTEGRSENTEVIVDAILNMERTLVWKHKLSVGGQYRQEKIINTDTIGTVPVDFGGGVVDTSGRLKDDTAALFLEDQVELRENLLLTLGGRVDHTDKYGSHVTPRVYLVWHPGEDWTLRGGVSKGFRAPTLKESSPGAAINSGGNGCTGLIPMGYSGGGCWMAGNAALKPEESTNYEVGLGYDRSGWKAGVTYFHTDFENKIEYRPLGYFEGRWWTRRENIERARTKGLEATFQAPLRDDLTWNTNVTWMIQAKNLVTGAQLITTPEWSAFSSLDWEITDRAGLFLSAQYTGKQLGGGTAITKGYTMFDLSGRFDVTETVTFRAGITNLLEKEISSSTGYNYYQPGRRFFVGMTSRF